MSSSYRKSLEDWLSQLDVKASRCIDIGGSQLQAKGRTKSWDVQEYLIADLPQPHKGDKPDIEIDINFGGSTPMKDKADLVFCLEVFEYVWNPLEALIRIKNTLTDGGVAYISFPSFYPMHEPVEDDCLRYMPSGIVKLAEEAGLAIVQMIPRRPETNSLQKFFADERLRAAKNQDHAFLGWIVEVTK